MITNPRVEINKKGIESENVKNVCNYIITSNNINWGYYNIFNKYKYSKR